MKNIDRNSFFTFNLIKWYRKNKRNLPWRDTKSPYYIWLSEIILQQTRVKQGLSYYEKFTSLYPTIKDLADAEEIDVLKDWQGLGYYSRARNLHATAQHIHKNLNGNFPDNYTDLRKLKGVGDYTAAAISSFAYDLPYAVLDGNVFRILSRFYGIDDPIDQGNGKKIFQQKADELIDIQNPAEHNQAIMEFAAMQCTPKNTTCSICPLKGECFAYKNNLVNLLPVKSKKTKQKKRYFHYLILSSNGKTIINQRNEKGIWHKLYDFPLIEFSKLLDFKELKKSEAFKNLVGAADITLQAQSTTYKHLLTHQRIFTQFYHLKVANFDNLNLANAKTVDENDLTKYPIPKLIENYLKEETNLLSLFRT